MLQSRIGYRPTNAGHLVLSAYGSALERGGDFAHWAQLTHDPNVDGSGTTVALGDRPKEFNGLTFPHQLHLDLRGGAARWPAGAVGAVRGCGSGRIRGDLDESHVCAARAVGGSVERRADGSEGSMPAPAVLK